MLAHSPQERSGLCDKPTETKQIEKKFLQAGFLRAELLGTLRCDMEKIRQRASLCSAEYSEIRSRPFGSPVMNRPQYRRHDRGYSLPINGPPSAA
jgi:hypothetical protein